MSVKRRLQEIEKEIKGLPSQKKRQVYFMSWSDWNIKMTDADKEAYRASLPPGSIVLHNIPTKEEINTYPELEQEYTQTEDERVQRYKDEGLTITPKYWWKDHV